MKEIQDLNVAIVGAGRMGRIRVEACQSLGANVISVCDTNAERANAICSAMQGCDSIASDSHLPWEELDAVFVCTPPVHRGAIEFEAIDRCIPFFVEKPLAVNAQKIQHVFDAIQNKPVLSAVGYQNRHRESLRRVKQMINHDSVLGLSAFWAGGPYNVPWWSIVTESGGAVNEQATHLLDLSRFLLGEVHSVSALASNSDFHTCTLSLKFESGSVASIFYTCGYSEKSIGLNLFTSNKSITLSDWDFKIQEKVIQSAGQQNTPEDKNNIFNYETEKFLLAVCDDAKYSELCDYSDAFKSQQLVDLVVESLRSGKEAVRKC